jgi:hypothetical protein
MNDFLHSAGPFPDFGSILKTGLGEHCDPGTRAPSTQGTDSVPTESPCVGIDALIDCIRLANELATDHADVALAQGGAAHRWWSLAVDLARLRDMLPRALTLEQSQALARICNLMQRIGV